MIKHIIKRDPKNVKKLMYKKTIIQRVISMEMKTIYFLFFIAYVGSQISNWYYISNTNPNIPDWYFLVAETLFAWLFAFALFIAFLQRYLDPATKNLFIFIISIIIPVALFIGPFVFFYIMRNDL